MATLKLSPGREPGGVSNAIDQEQANRIRDFKAVNPRERLCPG